MAKKKVIFVFFYEFRIHGKRTFLSAVNRTGFLELASYETYKILVRNWFHSKLLIYLYETAETLSLKNASHDGYEGLSCIIYFYLCPHPLYFFRQ